MPLLDERAVNEAVQFDSRFGNASMRTLLDTLIIGALGIDLGRLHKDHKVVLCTPKSNAMRVPAPRQRNLDHIELGRPLVPGVA